MKLKEKNKSVGTKKAEKILLKGDGEEKKT